MREANLAKALFGSCAASRSVECLGARRVWCRADVENESSWRVAERLELEQEGTLKSERCDPEAHGQKCGSMQRHAKAVRFPVDQLLCADGRFWPHWDYSRTVSIFNPAMGGTKYPQCSEKMPTAFFLGLSTKNAHRNLAVDPSSNSISST